MKHAAELAKAGHGQIVAVLGEAGVGKSRLFHEFKATNQLGWMVLEAFSVSHGKATAYLPLIELLQGYFRIAAEDDQRTRREKVNGRIVASTPHSRIPSLHPSPLRIVCSVDLEGAVSNRSSRLSLSRQL